MPRIARRSAPPAEPAISYRPDIDGLRAVAILSVLGYHAFPSIVRGGFVGVDVFFVISGFLITGIIVKGLGRGGFSLLEFYARRVRRIFPALIVVLLAVWAAGWLKLLPGEYTALARHVAAGAAYASNFLLYKESGYFDTEATLKPLLHLWSLGVEEQFYIFWPLLLLVTWRWRTRLPLLAAVTLASFVLNVVRIGAHPVSTFYLPMTRLWELSLGGLLACAQQPLEWRFLPRQVAVDGRGSRAADALARLRAAALWLGGARPLASAAGVVLLAVSILLFDPYHLYPGWRALAPTTGTLLLIAAGEQPWINRRLLASRAMVGVGLVSYPLYLWHWPLLSFLRIVDDGRVTTWATLGALALAFLLALLTYRLIEVPIRSARPALRVARPLFASLVVLGVASYVTCLDRYSPLSARYGVERVLSAASEMAFPGPHLERVRTNEGTFLAQGAGSDRVLFMGDSNVEQYYPRVDAILTSDPEHTHGVVYATAGGCPPIPGVHEDHHPRCEGLVARAIALAEDPRAGISTIVIGAGWNGYFYDPDPEYWYYFKDAGFRGTTRAPSEGARRAMSAFEAMVAEFVRSGKRVYIILQMPYGTAFDPHSMVSRSIGTLRFALHAPAVPRAEVASRIAAVNTWLTELASRHGVVVIDPMEALCGPTDCPALDPNGVPVYRDHGHLRPSYVRQYVRFLDGIVRGAAAAPLRTAALRRSAASLARAQ